MKTSKAERFLECLGIEVPDTWEDELSTVIAKDLARQMKEKQNAKD